MKPNAEQSEREFAYTYACKRMMNDCAAMQDNVDVAKDVALQGISRGAMITVEIQLDRLRDAITHALKTV
jgi:hypothetical protein